jgi:class 3 adenylate cyclase
MSNNIETLPAEPTPPGNELVNDAIITTHRILEAFGRDSRTLDILHADLYDSRPEIVLSALQAVAAIGDSRSFLFVTRLFQHADKQIVCAAVRAAGAIGGPAALPLLHSLAISSTAEEVSLEVLRVLARHFPQAPETRLLAIAISRSLSVQPETTTTSLEVLLQLESSKGVQSVLDMAAQHPAVLPSLFQLARQDKNLADALVAARAKTHGDLPLPLRSALVSLASPLTSEAQRAVFFDSLRSMNPTIRRECYRHIGTHATQLRHFDALCALLAENVEDDPSMEEEALQAVDSMASAARAERSALALPSLSRLHAAIGESYDDLRKAVATDIDTSHEIGQQLASAKEYMELYFSERAKMTFIDSIKSGGNPRRRREGAQVLKASAVKLEARHFEAYSIMYSLIADPSRQGIALFLRHLTHADTQKRKVVSRLKRLLSLARLSPPADAKDNVLAILNWARKMKFFHLAELALLALHRIDPESALRICRECMTPPVAAKVLAIAALQLASEMDIEAMETIFISLLHEDDRYIRLALLESLGSAQVLDRSNLLRSILQLFCAETDPEVASKLVEILGSQAETGIAAALIAVYDRFDEWKKALAITLLSRLARKCDSETRPALTEFFYRVLRADPLVVVAKVPAGLLALGDDYAPNVLRDLLLRMGPTEQSMVVRDLRGDLKPAVIAVIWSMLREKDPGLQQALREVLPTTADPRAQQLLVSMVRTLRTKASDNETLEGQAEVDRVFHLSSEKAAYRFEREKTLTCAVMFSDIQNYSIKAQEFSSLELDALLQEYEGLLLPIVGAHNGELVKRMGDGHLFVFRERLSAVLASIRVQKALRRYNRFHPERQRVHVRIGIHWGEVVERNGDVLGNTVNIASRLQSLAMGGSTCISKEVYEKVADWIHANNLGMISIKGLRDPIQVWEPTEATLRLPIELDPLKQNRREETVLRPQSTDEALSARDVEELAAALSQTLQHLRDVSRRSARVGEEAVIDEEFVRSWHALQPLLSSLENRRDEHRQTSKE